MHWEFTSLAADGSTLEDVGPLGWRMGWIRGRSCDPERPNLDPEILMIITFGIRYLRMFSVHEQDVHDLVMEDVNG